MTCLCAGQRSFPEAGVCNVCLGAVTTLDLGGTVMGRREQTMRPHSTGLGRVLLEFRTRFSTGPLLGSWEGLYHNFRTCGSGTDCTRGSHGSLGSIPPVHRHQGKAFLLLSAFFFLSDTVLKVIFMYISFFLSQVSG